MTIIRHMRRSAISAGRPGGLIREITWKAGETVEIICLHGGLRLCRLAGTAATHYLRKEDFRAWMVFVIIISSWLEQSSKRLLISDL